MLNNRNNLNQYVVCYGVRNGQKDTVTCWVCNGAGTVVEDGVRTPCPQCGGLGTQEV